MYMSDVSGDYTESFSKRLCARRILRLLKRSRLDGVAHQLERTTAVFFDPPYFRWLAVTARWNEVYLYTSRFFPDPRSRQADRLLYFAHVYRVLGMIASGGDRADDAARLWPPLHGDAARAHPDTAHLRLLYQHVRRNPPTPRAWMNAWEKAGDRLKNMALNCPELKRKLHLPHYGPKHCQINLCGLRSVPRPFKQKANKRKTGDIASFFVQKRQHINESLAGPALSSSQQRYSSDSMKSDMEIRLSILQELGLDTSDMSVVPRGDGSLPYYRTS